MDIQYQNDLSRTLGQILRAALGLTVVVLGLCGFAYSSLATGLGQLIFPKQANGSLIELQGRVIGSALVAQPFLQPQYFHPRPSAAGYDPMAMAGSNMARTSPELQQIIAARLDHVAQQEQVARSQIPADLVTASGSGIDPEISLQAAMIQCQRIARIRNIPEDQLMALIHQQTIQPAFGFLGQARVNVLQLNVALDQMQAQL